jgi:hypothetical protein
MEPVIELARFRVDPSQEAAFLATRPAMLNAVTRRLPELLRIELVRLPNNEWLDVVLWRDQASAASAPAIAEQLPEVREWLSHITEDVSMELGTVIDRGAQAVPLAS